MRHIGIVACALALAGCNLVYSEKPLFSAADSRGAQFRPGVWMKPEPGCDFDRAKPLKEWPECAGGIILRADRMVDPKQSGKEVAYVLADGEPPVVQIPFDEKLKKPIFVYAGVRVSKTDERGRITEFRTWIAQCGPPPPKPKDGAKPSFVTDHPLPGLKIDKESGMCIATSPGPVRVSVRASEAWDDGDKSKVPASWLRDGEE